MKKMFNYIWTSLASSLVDLLIFESTFLFLDEHGEVKAIFIATIIARAISSTVSYQLNKRYVFKTVGNKRKEFPKFVLVVIVQMLLSASLVSLTNTYIHFNELFEKCCIDLFLFFVFYYVNKYFVYRKEEVK